MAALPRDLQKPRAQRLSEVAQSLQQQAGQTNTQFVTFGCVVSPDVTHAYNFAVSAGEYCLGQALVEFAGAVAQAVPGGADPGAGQEVIVNIEGDSSGALHLTVGAIASGGSPVAPALTPAYILLGQLVITGAFTPGTTALTSGECVTTPYSAGNESPIGGF